MTPPAHNPDTREKLAICERLLVRTRYESGHRPQLVTGSETIVRKQLIAEAADTIEALVEAVEKCRDFLIHEAGFEDEDEPLKSLLAALSRARNEQVTK